MTLRLVSAGMAAVLLLTGCAVSVGAPTPDATQPTVAPSPEPPASQPTESAAPATRTWTYELVDAATRPAEATSAQLKGTADTYPDSTSLWVGCEGTPDEVTLATNGQYKRLFGHLGLRADVPAGIVVHTLVLVDGDPVQNIQLDSDDPAAVEVNLVLTGAQQVVFRSEAVAGECGESAESYVVLGDGYVE